MEQLIVSERIYEFEEESVEEIEVTEELLNELMDYDGIKISDCVYIKYISEEQKMQFYNVDGYTLTEVELALNTKTKYIVIGGVIFYDFGTTDPTTVTVTQDIFDKLNEANAIKYNNKIFIKTTTTSPLEFTRFEVSNSISKSQKYSATLSQAIAYTEVITSAIEYEAGDGIIIADETISADTTYVATVESVTSEATARASADTTLQTNIDNEAAARQTADTTLATSLAGKQDKLTAGSNIQINGTTISATDTTYTAGTNITITGNVISAAGTTYSAGDNIQITGNTISATDTKYTAGNGLILSGTEFTANITDNVTSSSTTSSLSANQGKILSDRISTLESRGKFLSVWNCTTGKPTTDPTSLPYTYKSGDYYIVGTIGSTNYKPSGTQYTGAASSTIESNTVSVNDTYMFDGSVWSLIHSTEQSVQFSSIGGEPTDNVKLAAALNSKQATLTAGTGIDITNNVISADLTYVNAYDIILSSSSANITADSSNPTIAVVGESTVVKYTAVSRTTIDLSRSITVTGATYTATLDSTSTQNTVTITLTNITGDVTLTVIAYGE